MSSITEQFSAATKSQLEAQFQIFNTLASTAVDSAEKVIALNINTTKASVEQSSAAAKQLLSIKDPKELFSLGTQQPGSFDALLAYGRALYSIASTAQSELVKSAQSTLQQVSELAVTKATAATVATVATAAKAASPTATAAAQATPPALAAAVSAAVTAANEPIGGEAAPVVKAPPKPKPAAAPIPEPQDFIEVKATVKPSFPEAAPKPIALAAEAKPAKAAPKAKK